NTGPSHFLADKRAILAGQPATHPLFELRKVHRIPMAFVNDQLTVHFGQLRTVFQGRRSKSHPGCIGAVKCLALQNFMINGKRNSMEFGLSPSSNRGELLYRYPK